MHGAGRKLLLVLYMRYKRHMRYMRYIRYMQVPAETIKQRLQLGYYRNALHCCSAMLATGGSSLFIWPLRHSRYSRYTRYTCDARYASYMHTDRSSARYARYAQAAPSSVRCRRRSR